MYDMNTCNHAICAEAFVTMPQRLLLNADLCHRDPVYRHAFSQLKKEAGAEIDSRHLLCLLLIVERAKREASLWHPYIQYLPETYGAPLKKVCPKDSASGCTTKPIFAAKSLNRYITVSIWIRFWHFNKVRRLPECNFGRQLIKFKALADDPLWWGEEEVALLGGTRLEIAVKQHHKIAAKLTGWRNRLVQLQRQVLRHDAAL